MRPTPRDNGPYTTHEQASAALRAATCVTVIREALKDAGLMTGGLGGLPDLEANTIIYRDPASDHG